MTGGLGSATKREILFVGGSGRSGSTILDVVLAQQPGFATVGEFRYIWSKGFGQDRLCGCGRPFSRCDFWSEVVASALGSVAESDAEEFARREKLFYERSLLREIVKADGASPELAEYVRVMRQLLQAVFETAGCQTIVDSSKIPNHLALLSRIPGIPIRLLHLVRDARAVAWSWARKKAMTNVHWKTSYMGRYGAFQSSRGWCYANLATEALRSRAVSQIRVRYEDFVTQPEQALDFILEFAGAPPRGAELVADAGSRLAETHGLAGNPARFAGEGVTLSPDVEWRARMAWSRKALVTSLCWPLLLRYGYLRPQGRQRAGEV